MPVGDIFLTQFGYEVNGVSCSNTFYSEMTDASTSADEAQACATAFAASLLGDFRDVMSVQTDLCFVKCWAVGSTLPPAFNLIVATTGNVLGDACPANKNFKILLRQSVFSARTNGELRISGVPESDATGNQYLGAFNHVAAFANIVTFLQDGYPGIAGPAGRYRVVIASSGLEAQGNPPVPNFLDVTQAEVRSLVYSDRRRTSRHQAVS